MHMTTHRDVDKTVHSLGRELITREEVHVRKIRSNKNYRLRVQPGKDSIIDTFVVQKSVAWAAVYRRKGLEDIRNQILKQVRRAASPDIQRKPKAMGSLVIRRCSWRTHILWLRLRAVRPSKHETSWRTSKNRRSLRQRKWKVNKNEYRQFKT